jgi:hypothetical protein
MSIGLHVLSWAVDTIACFLAFAVGFSLGGLPAGFLFAAFVMIYGIYCHWAALRGRNP